MKWHAVHAPIVLRLPLRVAGCKHTGVPRRGRTIMQYLHVLVEAGAILVHGYERVDPPRTEHVRGAQRLRRARYFRAHAPAGEDACEEINGDAEAISFLAAMLAVAAKGIE